MIDNSYYTQDVHGPYELYDIGNLELEEGGTIRGCNLAYATFGKLNAAKDNAILIPTWYSGTNKIMEQVYIGQGHALDPDKYFIVVVNQIGSGLSTSPHNTPAPAGMGNFPHVRIGDDVRDDVVGTAQAASAKGEQQSTITLRPGESIVFKIPFDKRLAAERLRVRGEPSGQITLAISLWSMEIEGGTDFSERLTEPWASENGLFWAAPVH